MKILPSTRQLLASRSGVAAPRDALAWFAQQMEIALRKNDHKLGWEHISARRLLLRCNQEVGELRHALARGDVAAIVKECADAANFLMMIADNAAVDALDKLEDEDG